jgi:CheY-like chemotaxis protein
MMKGTILIAEDERYTRNTLAFVLENDGYQVVEAKNGLDALRLIVHLKSSIHPIDLMILDIEMSHPTGWQILDELERYQVSIPIIVITGLLHARTLQRVRDKGCLEYLKKPFTPEDVTDCVYRTLKKQRLNTRLS